MGVHFLQVFLQRLMMISVKIFHTTALSAVVLRTLENKLYMLWFIDMVYEVVANKTILNTPQIQKSWGIFMVIKCYIIQKTYIGFS